MWTCGHRGDCCKAGHIVVTHEEAAILQSRASVPLLFTNAGDKVTLLGSPCPFYDGSCTIYEVRPYNCRRFMCGRDGDEPYDPQPVPAKVIQIRGLRRQYAMNQKKAQKWARKHGWSE